MIVKTLLFHGVRFDKRILSQFSNLINFYKDYQYMYEYFISVFLKPALDFLHGTSGQHRAQC